MASLALCPSCGELLPDEAAECPVCLGETLAKPLIPEISAYRIVRLIGKGGMGAVYLAEDNATKRLVAMKIMSSKLGEDSRGRNRFLREARTMSTIHHSNIVEFLSFGEFGGQPYIVMEYVEGETVGERIKRQGILPVREALRILRQTIDALEAAWEKEVIHRDIKPSNILLDKTGRVRVADFGLAKLTKIDKETTLTEKGYVIGSPHYISPEQAEGKNLNFRSDIYSLGIVLYEMLVGAHPFDATTPLAIVVQHLNTPLPSPREKRKEVPQSIVSLLQWMTRKEPEKRPSSYAELRQKIDSLLEQEVGKRSFSISKVLLAVGGIVAVALIATFWPRQDVHHEAAVTETVRHPIMQPANQAAMVSINVLPWGRIRLASLTKEVKVPSLSEKETITPCTFFLPEGEYSLEVTNDSGMEPLHKTIKVKSGIVNSFQFSIPAYDPRKSLAQIRGKR